MNRPRRYIWSEYVPYETLRTAAVLRPLASRAITPIVAVTPPVLDQAAGVVRACRDAGAGVGLWPMLDDADGRWASAANAERFCAFARALLDALDAAGARPDCVAIDLEPPIDRLRALVRGRLRPPPRRGSDAAVHYRALVDDIEQRGVAVIAAVMPTAILSRSAARRGWQHFFETPVDAIPFGRVSAMVYTSLLEGYSRGMVGRRDARVILARLAAEAHAHLGERASISLGCVGTGALGDERTFRSVAELGDDVAIARAAGVDHIALYNLEGVLARPPAEHWLDALVDTPAAEVMPAATWRARALWQCVSLAGRAASLGLPAAHAPDTSETR
jgi:hypothetical protein